MYITPAGIISVSAVVAAVVALMGYMLKIYKWIARQTEQDAEIKAMKTEMTLITYGLLAALKGLKEQGCNGPVTEAVDKIEKHINQQAHK